MKYIRLFSAAEAALGETKTPVVFYLKGAPKPMFAPKEKWGETCTIVIDDTEGSAGINQNLKDLLLFSWIMKVM